jgi:hypothetical protein
LRRDDDEEEGGWGRKRRCGAWAERWDGDGEGDGEMTELFCNTLETILRESLVT